jgi:CubicO group peptidase (beta-lactamase class C family)
MPHIDRRIALGGLLAAALPRRGLAALEIERPESGSLGTRAVGDLLAEHNVPGASLAIIHKGAVAATFSYGFACDDSAVTAVTRFQAASISKTINALAILKLVAQSRFGLDDPVNEHLTSWKLPDNAFTQRTPVTVRMLLSHSGGTTVTDFAGYLPGRPLPTVAQILDGDSPANSDPVRVAWPPGRAFHYSGGGVTILQQLVVDVTGQSYPAVVERLVLAPLGMTQSGYASPVEGAQVAVAHDGDGEAYPSGFRVHPELAAAGLWTTPGDLARAVVAIMRSANGADDAFLPQPLAQAMLTPVVREAGLGVFLGDDRLFTHVGATAGYRALFVADFRAERGTVVMTNGDYGDRVCAELNRRVAEYLHWG